MTGGDNSGDAFRWSDRPYAKAPWKRYVILGVAVAAGVLGVIVFGQPILGLVGFAIILGSTAEFWLGTRYRLDAEGATARTGLSVTAMRWCDVRQIRESSEGFKLSPLEKEGRMESFRGVMLRFGNADPERVREAVHKFAGDAARTLGGRSDGRADNGDD